MERIGSGSLQDFLKFSVLVFRVPVLAVAAEPGALGSGHLELLVRRERKVRHGGLLPGTVDGLPVFAGFLAEEQLARGVERKGAEAAAHGGLRRILARQYGFQAYRFRIQFGGSTL